MTPGARPARRLAIAVAAVGALAADGASARAGQRYAATAAAITPVPMASSCAAAAATEIDLGAAWLLVLAPDQARGAFDRAADLDPDCALAYWGRALSRFATAAAESAGDANASLADIARAASVPARTPFERAAVAALQRLAARQAAPGVPAAWPVRVAAYRDAICETSPATIWCARAWADTQAYGAPAGRAEATGALARVVTMFREAPLDVGAAVIVLESAGDPRAPIVDRALAALASASPPAPAPYLLAAQMAVRRGEWLAAAASSARVAAVSPETYRRGPALEIQIESLLQLGQRAEVYARASEATRLPADAYWADRDAAARAYARVVLGDRRLDGRGLGDRAALPLGEHVAAAWPVVFVSGLDAALRAWPGGDAAHLGQARRALETLRTLSGEDSVNEVDWAATMVEAAIAASQDEHQQMALLLMHAEELERRTDVVRSGRPLVPTRELAAELWLRTYRYDDARREARAVAAEQPNRISPAVVLARTASRLQDAAAADLWRAVDALRAGADADDSLRLEARRALELAK